VSSFIGVDLGGTKVAVATLEGSSLSSSAVEPTNQSGADALIDQLAELISCAAPDDLEAVGIGAASVVAFRTGRVVSSTNLPLADVPLRQALGARLGIPVFVDNDATVAALAEAHDERGSLVARNLVMLTIGTGYGCGLVLGGRIYRGATGAAGEVGHTIVTLPLEGAECTVPRPAGFPQPGSLEFAAAGVALDRLAFEAARLHPESALGRLLTKGKPVLGPECVEAAQAGDRTAVRTIEIWGERVGIGVANAINMFDPDEVVIGGGAARAGELLLEPVTRIARAYVLPGVGTATTIRLARHGVRAGVLGAALLAMTELEASAGASAAGVASSNISESEGSAG
jgi:glucokinase